MRSVRWKCGPEAWITELGLVMPRTGWILAVTRDLEAKRLFALIAAPHLPLSECRSNEPQHGRTWKWRRAGSRLPASPVSRE
jgi:hypothetical protein